MDERTTEAIDRAAAVWTAAVISQMRQGRALIEAYRNGVLTEAGKLDVLVTVPIGKSDELREVVSELNI